MAYYKKTGQRRKRSYLFHGKPGTGKTSTIVAMALYSKSHIIEIPGGSLKNSDDIDVILNTKHIDGVKISKTNLIIVLDEIDVGIEHFNRSLSTTCISKHNDTSEVCDKNKPGCKPEHESTISSEKIISTTATNINLANLLSKLDGISNYNGLIIIATTNHIEHLDPALYREMRLTPIEFKNLRKQDVINIIKRYFDIEITPDHELYNLILDRTITPAKMIYLCDLCYKLNIDLHDFVTNYLFKNQQN